MRWMTLIGVLAAAGPLAAQELPIATGKQGGGYDAYARTMKERVEQRGATAPVTNYNGSDEISLAMCQGDAKLGIMQIDAIYARQLEGCTLAPAAIYGTEYAFMLVPPDSGIDELSDLDEGSSVLVDTVGSGSELWWKTAVYIETEHGRGNDWIKATPKYEPANAANTLASFGDIDAAILVRTKDSADIVNLLTLGWTLAELWDRDINDLKFNGEPLYDSVEVTVQFADGRRGRAKDWVYEVRSYVVSVNEPEVIDFARRALN